MGYLVFAVAGTVAWTVVLTVIPVPWSLAIMGGVLWIYLKYFSGSWWPESTSEARRERFRAKRLSAGLWTWSLIAACLAVVFFQAGFVVTFRVVEFPAQAWTLGYDLAAVPPWWSWMIIVMASLVAGLTEEVGLRGYMQVPLEKRYGPAVGITMVSTMFAVLHLNQAWAPPVLLVLFAVSMMWGTLAYAAGSLIPAMISHAVADIFNFSYWWTDVAGTFDRRPIAETGIDAHFVAWASIGVVSAVLFAWASRKTLSVRRGMQTDQDLDTRNIGGDPRALSS